MSEFDLPPELAPPGPLMRIVRDQRVAFLIVGLLNTVFGVGTFIVISETLGHIVDHKYGRVPAALATLGLTHILSVLFAFLMHRRFVFHASGHLLADLLRFWSVYLTAATINVIALPLLVELGMHRIPAQLVIVASNTLLSWFGHRHFSFRRRADSHDDGTRT